MAHIPKIPRNFGQPVIEAYIDESAKTLLGPLRRR